MLKTLLMTGAAGGVGTALRPLLPELAETVVLSDLTDIADLQAHERFRRCDLADAAAVDALMKGVDGVIFVGGVGLYLVARQFLLRLRAEARRSSISLERMPTAARS